MNKTLKCTPHQFEDKDNFYFGIEKTNRDVSDFYTSILLDDKHFLNEEYWSFEYLECLNQKDKVKLSRSLYNKLRIPNRKKIGISVQEKMVKKLLNLHKLCIAKENSFISSKDIIQPFFEPDWDVLEEIPGGDNITLKEDALKEVQFEDKKYFKMGEYSPKIELKHKEKYLKSNDAQLISLYLLPFIDDLKYLYHCSLQSKVGMVSFYSSFFFFLKFKDLFLHKENY